MGGCHLAPSVNLACNAVHRPTGHVLMNCYSTASCQMVAEKINNVNTFPIPYYRPNLFISFIFRVGAEN